MRFAVTVVTALAMAGCASKARPSEVSTTPFPTVKGVQVPARLGERSIRTEAAPPWDTPVSVESPFEIVTTHAYYGTADPGGDRMRLHVHVAKRVFTYDEFELILADVAGWPQKGELTDTVLPDQGGRGGKAKCGMVKLPDSGEALCGWQLPHHMVFVAWYEHTVTELVAELPAIRDEVEVRA
ncbi:hypothetical protein Rhe02_12950 [Rhizocola hellebori]|uniref:Lipoprotein n=1 Tax=Rhizocola hellebori TaxID=1392758 RepID=A0A8J3Q3F8_9ACTN|nr:hypothetical protein Rhe02_12950 [Rhizocola hellebori]